jgi:hypothetical protein
MKPAKAPHEKPWRFLLPVLGVWCCLHCLPCLSTAWAGTSSGEGDSLGNRLLSLDNLQLGGHLKNRLALSWPDSDSFYRLVGLETLWDVQNEFRLNGRYSLASWGELEAHNETFLLTSDTQKLFKRLERGGQLGIPSLAFRRGIDDERRLMDLTWSFQQGQGTTLVNRFDRLSLSLFPSWGVVPIGRPAVTWGNGMLFNPMDIFAPFAPTALDRDYKPGEDAVSVQMDSGGGLGDLQWLYIPRPIPGTRHIEWEEASLAAKYHLYWSATESELTFMAGKHHEDAVLGGGYVTYIGEAAWRLDTTWTYLRDQKANFVSLVTNLDYGWVWWDTNFYGWIEYHYNGLGEGRKDYAEALENPALMERLERGEIFVRGRHYLDTQLRVELHPMLNAYLVTITNAADPSGIVQPYLVWDLADNVRLNLSATLFWGLRNTEYGGVELPGTDLTDRTPNNVFTWLTLYF